MPSTPPSPTHRSPIHRRAAATGPLRRAALRLASALLGTALLAPLGAPAGAQAQPARPVITISSTTSTEQSGLFAHLLPAFTRRTGIEAKVVALGTGQALDLARRGDADVVFVHDPAAEERFVSEGFGIHHRKVMYNDFVLIGPKADPARIAGQRDALEAMRRIAAAQAPFVSRGDRSGTHAAELRLWKQAGLDPAAARPGWYRETGSGMGPALNVASGMNAYILSDRGTWLSFRNRGDLAVLAAGDPRLFNQYGAMVVSPTRHPHVRAREAQAFVDWVVSPEGQQAIAAYQIGGEQLFFPNAGK